nr:hypothetical protein [Tanacetum cinerariifolium]
MDQPNPTFAKIPILDSGKFEQWNESSAKKKGRTVVITTEDMQQRRNDVKVRTTLLLALPDEHQLRFSKYETAKEFWEAILKTFGGNEATKKTKKNQLKQQYGNFKAKGSETLEQTFNRLQAILPVLVMTLDGHKVKHGSIEYEADRFWKNTGKKITIQGTDVASFDKSKVECFNCHKMGHFARECKALRSQDRGRRERYKHGSKEEEPAPKALMAIDEIGWDWSYMANEEENHALVADDEAPTEFALMAKSSSSSENEVEARLVELKTQEIKFCEKIRGLEIDVEFKNNKTKYLMNELEQVKKEKEGLDSKLTCFESASKDLDTLLGSQRTNKNNEGLRYNAVPPPHPAQVYSPPKKDMSWT